VPLTPADIHNMEFGKATLGKRGYDEEQVDILLDEVSREMIRLLEENDVLQRRAGRPAEPVASDGMAEAEFAAVAAELDRARRECDRAEQNARQLRDRLVQVRQASASRQVSAAQTAVVVDDRVLAMAQRTADDHLQDANQQSLELLAEAQQRCERLIRDARAAADDVERVAQRRHSEAASALQSKRTDLLREIEELKQFAEDYRAALESSMVRQQQHLEGAPLP
jgi:DivIVA domain-containing protein